MSKGPLQWSDDLLTGDVEIDGHHRTFYGKALRLFVACNVGRGPEYLGETFRFMRTYVEFHFEAEETRMRALDYPYIETHLEAHKGFLSELEHLEQELAEAEDKHAVARTAAELAVRWFNQHIKLVDRPLVEYLRQQGGEP